MRHVLECTKMDMLVITEFAVAHVTMVLHDFAYMLGKQVLQKEWNLRVVYVTQYTPVSPCRCSHLHISLLSSDRCGHTPVVDPQSQECSLATVTGVWTEPNNKLDGGRWWVGGLIKWKKKIETCGANSFNVAGSTCNPHSKYWHISPPSGWFLSTGTCPVWRLTMSK